MKLSRKILSVLLVIIYMASAHTAAGCCGTELCKCCCHSSTEIGCGCHDCLDGESCLPEEEPEGHCVDCHADGIHTHADCGIHSHGFHKTLFHSDTQDCGCSVHGEQGHMDEEALPPSTIPTVNFNLIFIHLPAFEGESILTRQTETLPDCHAPPLKTISPLLFSDGRRGPPCLG